VEIIITMIVDRNSPIPLYFQLQTWLQEQIEQGVFKPDDKIPTEEELGEITGLARATIRKAINNLVNMGYLRRKRRLGTFVEHHSKSENKRDIVGIIVPDIRTGYTPELVRGIEDEAANNRLSTILCNTDDLFFKANFHAERLINNSVCCVIFVPTAASDDKNQEIVDKFINRDIPVILADRTIDNTELDYVTTNNFDGGYQLTKYLINKGHKHIGITLSTLFSTERERFEGYKQALIDSGIEPDPRLIKLHDGPYTDEHYVKLAKKLLQKQDKITAIFAGHDRIAYVIYSVAKDMGISIPEDISVVGYDDLNPNYSNLMPLTTMHQPIYEMGQESLNILLKRNKGAFDSPQQIVLKSRLIERDSVFSLNKD